MTLPSVSLGIWLLPRVTESSVGTLLGQAAQVIFQQYLSLGFGVSILEGWVHSPFDLDAFLEQLNLGPTPGHAGFLHVYPGGAQLASVGNGPVPKHILFAQMLPNPSGPSGFTLVAHDLQCRQTPVKSNQTILY